MFVTVYLSKMHNCVCVECEEPHICQTEKIA